MCSRADHVLLVQKGKFIIDFRDEITNGQQVRGYLFWTQLLQVPLVALSKTRLLKGRDLLGNVVFWIGLFIGPSFLTSLYLVI